MKTVSERDALKDLSKFLRDMYCWCDHDASEVFDNIDIKNMKAIKDGFLRASDVITAPKFVVGEGVVLATDEVRSVVFYD